MAPTFSDVAALIIPRLNIGSGGAESTSANIQQWLRDATREMWPLFPPIQTSALTVAAGYTATLTNLDVHFVTYNGTTLIRGAEWNNRPTLIAFTPGAVAVADTVTAFFHLDHSITDASTSVDTSSDIFGADYLQPLLMLRAEMEAHNRLANVGATENKDFHASQYRVKLDDLEKMKTMYRARFEGWLASMQLAVQGRVAMGDGVMREGALARFVNKSRVHNGLVN